MLNYQGGEWERSQGFPDKQAALLFLQEFAERHGRLLVEV